MLKFRKQKIYMMFVMILSCTFLCGGCGNTKTEAVSSPQEFFSRRFGFKLPESAKFEQCDMDNENKYWAKILFNAEDYDKVCEGLNQVYPRPTVKEEVFNEDLDPFSYNRDDMQHIKNKDSWFVLTYEDVDLCYFRITSGKKKDGSNVRRIDNWVFTQMNDDNTVTMYVFID